MACAMMHEAYALGIYQVIWYLQKYFVRGVNHVLNSQGKWRGFEIALAKVVGRSK